MGVPEELRWGVGQGQWSSGCKGCSSGFDQTLPESVPDMGPHLPSLSSGKKSCSLKSLSGSPMSLSVVVFVS